MLCACCAGDTRAVFERIKGRTMEQDEIADGAHRVRRSSIVRTSATSVRRFVPRVAVACPTAPASTCVRWRRRACVGFAEHGFAFDETLHDAPLSDFSSHCCLAVGTAASPHPCVCVLALESVSVFAPRSLIALVWVATADTLFACVCEQVTYGYSKWLTEEAKDTVVGGSGMQGWWPSRGDTEPEGKA